MALSGEESIQELKYEKADIYQLIGKNTEVLMIRRWVKVTLSRGVALIHKKVNTRADI